MGIVDRDRRQTIEGVKSRRSSPFEDSPRRDVPGQQRRLLGSPTSSSPGTSAGSTARAMQARQEQLRVPAHRRRRLGIPAVRRRQALRDHRQEHLLGSGSPRARPKRPAKHGSGRSYAEDPERVKVRAGFGRFLYPMGIEGEFDACLTRRRIGFAVPDRPAHDASAMFRHRDGRRPGLHERPARSQQGLRCRPRWPPPRPAPIRRCSATTASPRPPRQLVSCPREARSGWRAPGARAGARPWTARRRRAASSTTSHPTPGQLEIVSAGESDGVTRRIEVARTRSPGKGIFSSATVKSRRTISLDANAQIRANAATNGGMTLAVQREAVRHRLGGRWARAQPLSPNAAALRGPDLHRHRNDDPEAADPAGREPRRRRDGERQRPLLRRRT